MRGNRIHRIGIGGLAPSAPRFSDQITRKIERLRAGLVGDVKALTNAEAGYRLRSGDFRVLFDSEGKTVVIRRVLNRRDAYR